MTTTYVQTRTPSRTTQLLVLTRASAGLAAWLAPSTTWRVTGLGTLPDRGSAVVISRLFGARDLAMAWAVAQPDPALRRAALTVGIAVDAMDTVAGLLGPRGGAPRASLLGVAAGAATLAGLGVASLRHSAPR